MKTVISSTGDSVQATFDQRFGRAAFFCIYDEETQDTKFVQNTNAQAQGGAGTKSAETMADLDATKVISGHFGPKAKDMLQKLNIQMVAIDETSVTIDDIIKKLKK